jgi:hypothetical protein
MLNLGILSEPWRMTLKKTSWQRNFQIEARACPVAALDRPAVCGRAFAGAGVDRILALAAQRVLL